MPVSESPGLLAKLDGSFLYQINILRSAINDSEPMKCLLANTWMNPDIEPQEFPHQAKACQSSEAEPSHPSVDSPQDCFQKPTTVFSDQCAEEEEMYIWGYSSSLPDQTLDYARTIVAANRYASQ
ncbi:predicted protein [Aspergillus nidulans FGSC A4]|nr:predicted protein [Aspergillus nidulans FGSC A4]|eukprot:XP_659905.1 predicted protein [Aspergillus nidulans FGSC A4]